MKRLLILTEAGPEIGHGHLSRCRSLASAFGSRGYLIELFVDIQDTMLAAGESALQWNKLPDRLQASIRSADMVIVDSYIVGLELIEKIYDMNHRTVIIDDYPYRHYRSGVVVDCTVNAEHKAFLPREDGVRYLLGSKYCPLRQAFWSPLIKTIKEIPSTILITLGGCDVRELTKPIAEKMLARFPGVRLAVVLGGQVKANNYSRKLSKMGAVVHANLSAMEMCKIMDRADVAISGGGQTLYELASRGLPAVVIKLVENQTADVEAFSSQGFSIYAGEWAAPNLLENIGLGIEKLWTRKERLSRYQIGRSLVDENGVWRLVSELEKIFE